MQAVSPAEKAAPGSGDGVILLDEEVHLVDPSGRVVTAIHRQLEPLTYAGARRASRIAIPFRPETEAAYLVLARRIRPDGTTTSVRDDAVLLETPQLLVDQECYADVAEIVILFPGVAPGDVVDYVVVKEIEPIIPGEYATFLPVADPWPQLWSRRQILLPSDMARRLRSKPLGLGEVHPESSELRDDLSSFIWEFRGLGAVRMERKREPIRQAGPGIWLGTIEDWSAIGAWSQQLLEGTDTLDEELDRLARQWIGSSKDPLELARTVTRYVSENVTYLGLEFGMAGFRPKPAGQVWRSRFGDCKDQANLSRVLLGALGVPSYLALVNTQHAGLIEKAIPSCCQFNHVLIAVQADDGHYVFFDPTVPALKAGDLPPSVLGREALVLRPEGSEFVRIPAGSAGELSLDFDFRVTPQGQLHGWLRLRGRGYQGALLAESLAGSASGSAKEVLERFLEPLPPGSQVIEAVDVSGGDDGDERVLESYLWVPAVGERRMALLVLPFADLLLPELGERRRQTRFYQRLGIVRVRALFHLPAGSHTTGEPPVPISVRGTAVATRAEWKLSEGRLEGEVSYESIGNLLDQAAFAALFEVRDRLQGWLATPVTVHFDGCPLEEVMDASLVDLPRLRTATGQIRLVDALFPETGNNVRRRAALVKVGEWFPNDSSAIFDARANIAVIDQRGGRAADSVRDIRDLLECCGQNVDEETRAWAEYLLADGLRLTGRTDEAREIYDRLSRQPGLSVHRRGWAYARAAFVRRHSAPLEAIAILEEGTQYDSQALPQQVLLLIELLSAMAPQEAINDRLDKLGLAHPHRIPEIHERLADEISLYLDEGETARAESLARLLVARIDSDPDLSFLAERATGLRQLVGERKRCNEIAARMKAYVESNMPGWWTRVGSEIEKASREDLIAVLQRLDRTEQARDFVRISFEVLTRFQVAPDFFGFLLFRCAGHLDAAECEPELRDRFLDWCEQLPDTNRFRSAAAALRESIEDQDENP